MSTTLPEFSSNSRCIKCGERVIQGIGSIAKIEYNLDDDDGTECLIRTCRRCGYKWKERCLDG